MNASTTSRRGRYATRAAAITTAALILGTAACGTEKASDNGEPAAPAATPHARAKATPHPPSSADAAERRAYEQRQEQYRRHLEAAAPAPDLKSRRAREIPLP